MSVASMFPMCKFSADRHRPHSRLNDWHTVDYDEEIFMDLSYCDKTLLKNDSILGITFNRDITEDFRTCSTSTPLLKPIINLKSGLNDLDVAGKLADCQIGSQTRNGGHVKCERNVNSDCVLFTSPLPCRSLRFEGVSSSSDEDDICESILTRQTTKPIKTLKTKSSAEITGDSQFSISNQSFSHCSEPSQSPYSDSGYETQPLSTISNLEDTNQEILTKSSILQKPSDSIRQTRSDTEVNSALLSKVLSYFSPKTPEVLIGRKIGIDSLDIIENLYVKNIFPALEIICSFLSDKDLFTFSEVNITWKSVVFNDTKSNQRRHSYIKSKKSSSTNKENKVTSPKKKDRGLSCTKDGPLTSLQTAAVPSKPSCTVHSGPVTRYQVFVQEARKLKNDESLRKCPLCLGPAKTHSVQERACCINQKCLYDFCVKCRSPFHGSKACTAAVNKKTKTEGSVGTKKSKKNLKRL